MLDEIILKERVKVEDRLRVTTAYRNLIQSGMMLWNIEQL